MSLLSKFHSHLKKEAPADLETVRHIQERVRTMRDQLGERDVELADLFALVREDERSQLRKMDEVSVPEVVARVWPDQVPSKLEAGRA